MRNGYELLGEPHSSSHLIARNTTSISLQVLHAQSLGETHRTITVVLVRQVQDKVDLLDVSLIRVQRVSFLGVVVPVFRCLVERIIALSVSGLSASPDLVPLESSYSLYRSGSKVMGYVT